MANLPGGSEYLRLINHTSDSPYGPNNAVPYLDTLNRVGLTTANARALGRFTSASSDGTVRFNSLVGFDLNPDDGITPGLYDFVGAATHELGHVLGFLSGVDDLDLAHGTRPAGDFSSNLLDLFRYSALSYAAGNSVTDYTADPRPKYFSLDGGATAVDFGVASEFATGVVYGDGYQASHWRPNQDLGVMEPYTVPGEALAIGPSDLLALDVIGWDAVPEPAGVGALIVGAGLLFLRRRSDTGA